MPRRANLFASALAACALASVPAFAQDAAPGDAVDEVLVLARDKAGLLE